MTPEQEYKLSLASRLEGEAKEMRLKAVEYRKQVAEELCSYKVRPR